MDKYIVSARKYRPSTFESVVGQKALTATLKNAVATGRLAHSYLFCGPRGVGKTSCARIFAKTINCEHRTATGEACNECDSCRAFNNGTSMNIIELDAASNNGVDAMRSLVEQTQTPPATGQYRVFIVDEVHMLSSGAFNAFLKTLEEPPSYVVFILATTEKHKIIPTILSRCQIYDFHRITIDDMVDQMAMVAGKEGITADRRALSVIARKADGAMRDALSIFDQVAASSRGNITYESAIENLNVLDSACYASLVEKMLKGDVIGSWCDYKAIRDRGFDSQFMLAGLAGYIRDLMVAPDAGALSLIEGTEEEKKALAEQASRCNAQALYKCLCLLNDADLNYRVASNKQLHTELTLAKLCQQCGPSPAKSADDEGHVKLQPIAAEPAAGYGAQPKPTQPTTAAQPTPAPAPAPASAPVAATATAPQPKPAAPKAAPQPASYQAPAPRRVAGVPNISIKGLRREEAAAGAPTAAQQPSTRRTGTYTLDTLDRTWDGFAAARPTMHILVNTMRASRLKPVEGKPDNFVVTVENEMQRDTLLHSMPDLLRELRDAAGNDFIAIEVDINRGETARHTWNDREVLNRLMEEHPGIKRLVADLKLNLG